MREMRTSDPVKLERRRRVFAEFEGVLASIEILLAEERHSNRDLEDKEVLEAMDLLLATLRTEEKGVLYERTSSDLQTDTLRRRLMELVESHRNPKDESHRRLRLGEAIECLEVLRDIIECHAEGGATSMSYVDFLARLLPRKRHVGDSGSSIIIPGRN
jgi:hypothetical protein